MILTNYQNDLRAWAEGLGAKVRPEEPEWADLRCRAHDDRSASASIKVSSSTDKQCGWVICHAAGCRWQSGWADQYAQECGLSAPPSKPRKFQNGKTEKRPKGDMRQVEEYIYRLADGNPSYKVVRRVDPQGNKDFRQARWTGQSWEWRMGNTPRVLYRLPELAASDGLVIIVEGEKDVHQADGLGRVATTTPQGAGNAAKVKDWSPLAGRDVVIIPDNDKPGEAHARQVAGLLAGVAASVGILRLPNLPIKGDLSSWVEGGGDKSQLDALLSNAVVKPDASPEEEPQDPRAVINIKRNNLKAQKQALAQELALLDPPIFFRKDDVLISIRERKDIIHPSVPELRSELDELFRFEKLKKKKEEEGGGYYSQVMFPPQFLIESLRVTPHHLGVPTLRDFTVSPVVLPDGTVTAKPGYYPAYQTYYSGLIGCGEVPHDPTSGEIREAVRLLNRPLQDFPFVDEADKTNIIALQLLLVGRGVISGLTPAWMVSASTQGTGKGLLTETAYRIATGQDLQTEPWKSDGEEFRKSVTTSLMEASRLVCFDNVNDVMDSANFSALVTAKIWKDRQLGSNKSAAIENRTVFMATANNPTMSAEVQRRFVTSELATELENPADRIDFKIRNLSEWVSANQESLLAALLTLWRAWFAAGKPRWRERKLGSFEEACEILGGVLQVAGIDGFLANKERVRAEVDTETAAWRSFASAWWEIHKGEQVTTSQLHAVCVYEEPDLAHSRRADPLLMHLLGSGNDRSQTSKLGRALAGVRNRVFGVFKVRRSEKKSSNTKYYLEITRPGAEIKESYEEPSQTEKNYYTSNQSPQSPQVHSPPPGANSHGEKEEWTSEWTSKKSPLESTEQRREESGPGHLVANGVAQHGLARNGHNPIHKGSPLDEIDWQDL